MAAGNAAGKQNSGAGISRHIFHTTAYNFFLYYICLRSKESSWAKKRCDVLDETLGLYEICLQVTQTFKGPDNPTSQLLPIINKKCGSKDGDGRKNKGGGGGCV